MWESSPTHLLDKLRKAKDESYEQNQAASRQNDYWIHELGKAEQRIHDLESKLKCCQDLFDSSCKDYDTLRGKLKKVVKKWRKYSSPQPDYMDSPPSPEYYYEQQMKDCADELEKVISK
jgi:ElaB/YqjD/DUF883 family membrane-anchored ribosome-binding protein